jgi:hypothetical protein
VSQRAKLIVALLAIVGSGAMLYKFFAKPKLMDDNSRNLFDAYTQVTAQEISHLLGGRGDVVVLMWGPPADDAKDPAGPPDVQAICRALQQAGLRVLAKERVPPVHAGYDVVWTAENYHQVLELYPQAGALVSFVGAPQLSAENIRALPASRPKLIVARGANAEIAQNLLDQGVLDGAVLPPTERSSSDHPPKTTREWFDKYYSFGTHK